MPVSLANIWSVRVFGQTQKQKQKIIVSLINTMWKTNGIQNLEICGERIHVKIR